MPNGTDGAIMKWIRANPLKTITFVFVAISSMITSAWAIETRYNNRPQIYQVSQDSLEGRIQNYEDRIFELTARKGSAQETAIDDALIQRAQQRMENLQKEKFQRQQKHENSIF